VTVRSEFTSISDVSFEKINKYKTKTKTRRKRKRKRKRKKETGTGTRTRTEKHIKTISQNIMSVSDIGRSYFEHLNHFY
jgi:hypothetical protein